MPSNPKGSQVIFHNPRPLLVIELARSVRLGHCYSGATYKITSRVQQTGASLRKLWLAGVLGYGQEFRVLSQTDGREAPAGHDEVPAVLLMDDGSLDLTTPALNWEGKPCPSARIPYYVYETETRCDSGG